jgi:hypothetical protein
MNAEILTKATRNALWMLALGAALVLATGFFLSGATRYCPLSHVLDLNMSCKTISHDREFILISHVDVDAATTEFTAQKGKRILWHSNLFRREDQIPLVRFVIEGGRRKVQLDGATVASVD